MSRRAWLALCGCMLVMGMTIGWSARIFTARDRYFTSMAMKFEAVEHYYNVRLDQAIQENERSLKRGK